MRYEVNATELSEVQECFAGLLWEDGHGNTVEVQGDRAELIEWLRAAADRLNCSVDERDPGPDDQDRCHKCGHVGQGIHCVQSFTFSAEARRDAAFLNAGIRPPPRRAFTSDMIPTTLEDGTDVSATTAELRKVFGL